MEGCIGAWSPLWWPELQAASSPPSWLPWPPSSPPPSLPPVEGWRRMQAVLPTPSNPSVAACQYSAVRGVGGERGVQSVGSMPPHSRGRTNSLTYTRNREMVGNDAATYQREEGRGSQRQPTGPRSTLAPNSGPRRLEDRERRVRRGGGDEEEGMRRRRGGERRLSAPSSRGLPTSESDQFVIDHLVNLDLVGRGGGGVGPNGKQTSDSADLQVSNISKSRAPHPHLIHPVRVKAETLKFGAQCTT